MLHVRGTPISVTALVHESLAKEHQAHVIFTIRVRPPTCVWGTKANIKRRPTAILTEGTWDGESMGTRSGGVIHSVARSVLEKVD